MSTPGVGVTRADRRAMRTACARVGHASSDARRRVAEDDGYRMRCLDCGTDWKDVAPQGKVCPGCLSHSVLYVDWDVMMPWPTPPY